MHDYSAAVSASQMYFLRLPVLMLLLGFMIRFLQL